MDYFQCSGVHGTRCPVGIGLSITNSTEVSRYWEEVSVGLWMSFTRLCVSGKMSNLCMGVLSGY